MSIDVEYCVQYAVTVCCVGGAGKCLLSVRNVYGLLCEQELLMLQSTAGEDVDSY